jgi:hypothetical protein
VEPTASTDALDGHVPENRGTRAVHIFETLRASIAIAQKVLFIAKYELRR